MTLLKLREVICLFSNTSMVSIMHQWAEYYSQLNTFGRCNAHELTIICRLSYLQITWWALSLWKEEKNTYHMIIITFSQSVILQQVHHCLWCWFLFITGAIEVSIATMSKVERCCTKEVYVVGFVPSYLLPKKRPISLDPFLEPLMQDIEEGFINGLSSLAFVYIARIIACHNTL